MNDRKHAADHQSKYGDCLSGAGYRLSPFGFGQSQNGRDQRARVRDPDPEDEIDQVKGPEDRPANVRDADAAIELIAPGNQAPKRNQAQRQQHREITPACSLQRAPEISSYVVHAISLARDKTPLVWFPALRETVLRGCFRQAGRLCFPDRSDRRIPSLPTGRIARRPAADYSRPL